MKRIIAALVMIGYALLKEPASGENIWSPAYSDSQIKIINQSLEKWKHRDRYPAVKDIFRGRSYEPDWRDRPTDLTPWDLVPKSFLSEREARNAGCQCDFIKNLEVKPASSN